MFPVNFSLRNGFSTSEITRYHGNTKQQHKSFPFTTASLTGKVTNGPESNFLLFYRYLYTRFSIFQRINYPIAQHSR